MRLTTVVLPGPIPGAACSQRRPVSSHTKARSSDGEEVQLEQGQTVLLSHGHEDRVLLPELFAVVSQKLTGKSHGLDLGGRRWTRCCRASGGFAERVAVPGAGRGGVGAAVETRCLPSDSQITTPCGHGTQGDLRRLSQKDRLRALRLRHRNSRRARRRPILTRDRALGRTLWGYVVATAPRQLEVDEANLGILLRYLNRIHLLALGGKRRVLVDLSRCEFISPVACLMLTAELQRCLILRPHCINGVDPNNDIARWTLDALGFYRMLGMESPRRRKGAVRDVFQIQSGGLDESVNNKNSSPGKRTYQVARIAMQAFEDELFAERVHVALNEAADNAIEWAYDPSLINPARSTRRWWICGFKAQGESRAFFFAYDQGASIPRTAPITSGERVEPILQPLLAKLGLRRIDAQDSHILEATIKEQRTRSDREHRGKGLTRMIQLADLSHQGSISIHSGRARYFYGRELDDDEPMEFASALPYYFPGTLIIWHVAGPVGRTAEEPSW